MEDFDEFIIEQVTHTVSELKKHDHDGVYKSNVLCRDIWKEKEFEELHNIIGRRIKQLADNNRLPIYYVGRARDNGAEYKLK